VANRVLRGQTCSFVDKEGKKCELKVFNPLGGIEEQYIDEGDRGIHPPSVHCEHHLDSVPFFARFSYFQFQGLVWLSFMLLILIGPSLVTSPDAEGVSWGTRIIGLICWGPVCSFIFPIGVILSGELYKEDLLGTKAKFEEKMEKGLISPREKSRRREKERRLERIRRAESGYYSGGYYSSPYYDTASDVGDSGSDLGDTMDSASDDDG